jgi:hypothetical protein
MTWEVLDIESGDVLAAYDRESLAYDDVAAYVIEHPDFASELAVATIDDAGCAVHMVTGTELLGHRPAGQPA